MSENAAAPEGPAPEGQVIDAVPQNWVDTLAPAWSRPYLRLSRADRPIGTWLLLLPCWWGVFLAAASTSFKLFDLWIIFGCAFGAFLMRGAGCTRLLASNPPRGCLAKTPGHGCAASSSQPFCCLAWLSSQQLSPRQTATFWLWWSHWPGHGVLAGICCGKCGNSTPRIGKTACACSAPTGMQA